ncbi:hypothetical protein WUBG_09636 [Wuchereria bancrofti]|uniref:Uncharacterized protein n=1 Tax=Wuchereria bancrofti TaxID=6293 RepID=J9EW81_WUCBA|nr:hypothetical protein WUBG_09636 [Wuchereria bancrofti]
MTIGSEGNDAGNERIDDNLSRLETCKELCDIRHAFLVLRCKHFTVISENHHQLAKSGPLFPRTSLSQALKRQSMINLLREPLSSLFAPRYHDHDKSLEILFDHLLPLIIGENALLHSRI